LKKFNEVMMHANKSNFLPEYFVMNRLIQHITNLMKKALKETQTLRAGCSKAEPKIFAPPQTPFPGAQDGQNLINWRWSVPSPTNPVW